MKFSSFFLTLFMLTNTATASQTTDTYNFLDICEKMTRLVSEFATMQIVKERNIEKQPKYEILMKNSIEFIKPNRKILRANQTINNNHDLDLSRYINSSQQYKVEPIYFSNYWDLYIYLINNINSAKKITCSSDMTEKEKQTLLLYTSYGAVLLVAEQKLNEITINKENKYFIYIVEHDSDLFESVSVFIKNEKIIENYLFGRDKNDVYNISKTIILKNLY